MDIRAFRALRPAEGLAEEIAAPPYDVVDTAEARRLAEGRPRSFLHVNRSEIDLPDGADPRAPEVYARAAENLRAFRQKGWLVRDAEPALYLYRQVMDGRAQCGLVAACSVDEYAAGAIRKHEHTRAVPEADRTRHIEATGAQVGPVFLLYRDAAGIAARMAADTEGDPLYDLTAPDGVRHTIWRTPDPEAYRQLFAAIPTAYIADGHHRASSAWRVAQARRAAHPDAPADAPWNRVLAVLFPSDQVRILAYNRCIADLAGRTPEAFLEALAAAGFRVTPDADPTPDQRGRASMYLGGRWYGLSWAAPEPPDPVASLDASVLQDRLFGPLLGIGDPRGDERIRFVGGIRGTAELARRVDAGRDAVAFSLYPTSVDELLAVADAGRTMPPKSTWFEPKLRSGLLVYEIE